LKFSISLRHILLEAIIIFTATVVWIAVFSERILWFHL